MPMFRPACLGSGGHRMAGGLGPRGYTQFGEDRRHVVVDGAGREEETLRDLGVREAFPEHVEDLRLPGRETGGMGCRGCTWPPLCRHLDALLVEQSAHVC